MKHLALQKHLQTTKYRGQKYYIEYKPKGQTLWCYYDCKWPHYNHTPQLIKGVFRKYPDSIVKLSRYDPMLDSYHGMDPLTDEYLIVSELN